MNPLTFETIKETAWAQAIANWGVMKVMLESLTDEEIEKIPDIGERKEAAERYGINDVLMRRVGTKHYKNTYVYFLSGYLFKGETKDSFID